MSAAFDVRYTAQLARLHLSEEEIAKFQTQLSQGPRLVEKLEQVDVSGVETDRPRQRRLQRLPR